MTKRSPGKKTPGKKAKENGSGSNGNGNGISKQEAGLLARQDVTAAFKAELDRYKVTDKKIAQTIYASLNAKITKVFYDRETGDVVYSTPMTDNTTRLKAAELAAKLRGHEPAKKLDIDAEIGIKTLSDEQLTDRIIELIGKAGVSLPVKRAGQKKTKT